MNKIQTFLIKQLLSTVKEKQWSGKQRALLAEKIAAALLQESNRVASRMQKRQQQRMARLVSDQKGKVFFASVADQAFRSHNSRRSIDQMFFLLATYGTPAFLSKSEQVAFRIFSPLARAFPTLSFPLVKKMVRFHTQHVILDDHPQALKAHIAKRKEQGIEVNVNFIGEAVLGEEEAKRRVKQYTDALRSGLVHALSIKISTIASQISLLGFSSTLEILKKRFREVLDAALEAPNETLVALDMEEYRDLELTKELYISVLAEEKYYPLQVAIALQAYIPDSFRVLKEIEEFAKSRCERGGKPLRVRIVKGANLSMEQITSSLSGWPQAPFTAKRDVDAQYKKMLHYAFDPKRAKFLEVGVASHNLFDIAYALVLAAEEGVEQMISFEMLEGMVDPLPEVLAELTGRVLVYAPVSNEKEFAAAFAYLVRRLDEATYPNHFLQDAFGLVPGSERWNRQKDFFIESIPLIGSLTEERRRCQSRLNPVVLNADAPFDNDSHTDPTFSDNRIFAESVVSKWRSLPTVDVFPQIAGKKVEKEKKDLLFSPDPSQPGRIVAATVLIDEKEAQDAVRVALEAYQELSSLSFKQRSEMLYKVACEMQKRRGDLIGAMMAEGGKVFEEADLEVSEAIDFIEYYRRQIVDLGKIEGISWQGARVGLVTSPWNFPLAIPTSGIVALLLTGASVLFKPAPEVPLIGSLLVECFYQAGIDRRFLQFVPCADHPVGSFLIKNESIDAVILTGATETAKKFLHMRQGLSLFAETGGKNAIIVSALADRDLAVRDIVHSAFGHAGQKCSACSLAILEEEVYKDPHFLKTLCDAARSLPVGSVWDLHNKVGPLIRPPQGKLLQGLKELEEGESWLLEPKQDASNPHLWTPGIKKGVRLFSFTQQTELFGPVLGLLESPSFSDALTMANSTRYGLTAGLQSLDKRELWKFSKEMQAGNLYINRGITGAIVQRQPFGGCKDSSFGPGKKAGGPNYLIQLMRPCQQELPNLQEGVSKGVERALHAIKRKKLSEEDWNRVHASALCYAFYWKNYFSKEQDPSRLLGQDNFLRYMQQKNFFYLQSQDRIVDLYCAALASLTCGSEGFFFLGDWEEGEEIKKVFSKEEKLHFTSSIEEFEEQRENAFSSLIRTFSAPCPALLAYCQENAAVAYFRPVVGNGRIELVHYLREVAISIDYHRYGNQGLREQEVRKGPSKI